MTSHIHTFYLQSNIIDPHGIAVHYIQNKLYWVDR